MLPERPEAIYTAEFFDFITRLGLASARVVVPLVVQLLRPASVVDFGCGEGAWLRAFQENGVSDVLGLDGEHIDRTRLLIDPSCFQAVNLTETVSLPRRYDLALCLEVAEHLPQRSARELVRTLTAAAPLVLFSAAVPGQGGIKHVNEQWPAYWQGLFAERGCRKLDLLRRRLAKEDAVAPFYRQNLLLYASEPAVAESSVLRAEAERSPEDQMEFIMARILDRYTSFLPLLRELPRAALRALRKRWYA